MQVFLVGGAVRDGLLGRKIKDRDYVVLGARQEDMLAQGFLQVGKSFPVFLHPKTGEEYALARKERKIGRGHKGFSFDFSQSVSLEEDLYRRDLTINAIAQDDKGHLIDPYHGICDLKKRILRHVSDAFVEDPLRVLRTFRLYAELSDFSFEIAPETWALCKEMIMRGDLFDLSYERILQETERALKSNAPLLYFDCLYQAKGMNLFFDDNLDEDIFQQAQNALQSLLPRCQDPAMRFAFWLKAFPKDKRIILRKKLPFSRHYLFWFDFFDNGGEAWTNWQSLSAKERWNLIKLSELMRDDGNLYAIFNLFDLNTNLQKEIVDSLSSVRAIKAKDLMAQGFFGPELGKALKEQQILCLANPKKL